ncbi:hypothetical protein [Pseudonocardia sp. ICBG601]|uniref:hypothetical protein n=1 Tax=Pseudonocardia sp. ICBG601 TaxID=2846759 RepID=UPI001CF6DFCE|nr:hypothetical protein [Pseudonocardia sp. ICBG601]
MTALHDLVAGHLHDENSLAVVPAVTEDSAPRVREGLARRRQVAVTGRCPCGATMAIPSRAQRRAARRAARRIHHVAVIHADSCPAIDPFTDEQAVG